MIYKNMEEQNKVNIEVVSVDDLIQDDHISTEAPSRGSS